ncbi:hypothetical protein E2P81_ATG01508 [Venturia nashicola]|uniref:CCD97-like C-terminal domain-containing protein n=1 Tax=Venturia nashicola TaxID=86259 RepID=A0A4Z1PF47_9PEZI|nr:hypothetical protein E6O75_ATG01546 [Venturia nashicola]TLD38965.1 hypothetical protein E2P81_ATG01508 [Venturia nashicola]
MPYFHQRVVPLIDMDTPMSQPEDSPAHQEDKQSVPNHIRIKNRRKRYLDLHPDYFNSSLELADPLMYDRLVRRFQTPAEREAEGRDKGYSGVLEADLRRSEAKLQAIANPDPNATFTYIRGPDGEIIPEEKEDVPVDKDEGFARWKYEMELRFLRGDDHDFEYVDVDESDEYDDIAEEDRARQEEYFGQEEPIFVLEDGKDPEGETGILDY